MWEFIRSKVANFPAVKKMSPAQKKRVGGRIIITGTILLLIPLTGMFLSLENPWVHVFFQVIWVGSMMLGSIIAFESGDKRPGTR